MKLALELVDLSLKSSNSLLDLRTASNDGRNNICLFSFNICDVRRAKVSNLVGKRPLDPAHKEVEAERGEEGNEGIAHVPVPAEPVASATQVHGRVIRGGQRLDDGAKHVHVGRPRRRGRGRRRRDVARTQERGRALDGSRSGAGPHGRARDGRVRGGRVCRRGGGSETCRRRADGGLPASVRLCLGDGNRVCLQV
jgi:hypothetical protein